MATQTRFIDANGLTHAVDDTGNEQHPVALLLHGFPDSRAVWHPITAQLVDAGYRVIAPDMRGFGDSDMATHKNEYEINIGAIPDMIGILDALAISTCHVVGHDFGAPVAWSLTAQYPQRFTSLSALSVGHIRAFLRAGIEQKLRSWYILLHQCQGLCEWAYRFNRWYGLRRNWSTHGDVDAVINRLDRPGRLTAGLNWYRTNLSIARIIRPPAYGQYGEERVRRPTLGVWSENDPFLTEQQMTGSSDYVDAPWTYTKMKDAGHWLQLDAPDELAALLVSHWRSTE